MNRKNVIYFLFGFGLISLIIGIYQILGFRIFSAVLSFIYSAAFFAGGYFSRKKESDTGLQ